MRAIVLALMLTGCATTAEIQYVPTEVKVPVPVPCVPAAVDVPEWATSTLKPDDDIDTKVRALLAERKQRLGYEEKLIASMDGCK